MDDFLHEELARTEGLSHIYNILRTAACLLYTSGRRFLLYIAALKEIPRRDAALQVQRVAALVHLSSELEKRLAAYSGGMKQRLLAAAALLGEPQILIMDEPDVYKRQQ